MVSAYCLFVCSNLRHRVYNLGGGASNTFPLLELLLLREFTGKSPSVRWTDWRRADQEVKSGIFRNSGKSWVGSQNRG